MHTAGSCVLFHALSWKTDFSPQLGTDFKEKAANAEDGAIQYGLMMDPESQRQPAAYAAMRMGALISPADRASFPTRSYRGL